MNNNNKSEANITVHVSQRPTCSRWLTNTTDNTISDDPAFKPSKKNKIENDRRPFTEIGNTQDVSIINVQSISINSDSDRPVGKTVQERVRQHRARKKLLENVDSTMDKNKNDKPDVNVVRKTSTSRIRLHRERKKLLKNVVPNAESDVKLKAMTPAERTRLYRLRKKLLKNVDNSSSPINTMIINENENISEANVSTSRIRLHRERKNLLKNVVLNAESDVKLKTMTPAKRTRLYRLRKKLLKNVDNSSSPINTMIIDENENISNANVSTSRIRLHRERKNLLKNVVPNAESDVKLKAMTPAERTRLYRLRKELLKNVDNSSSPINTMIIDENENISNANEAAVPYNDYYRNIKAHNEFDKKFRENIFGIPCSICDRLWFKNDLKKSVSENNNLLQLLLPNVEPSTVLLCATCKSAIQKNKIPPLAVYNGFKYPEIPKHLPPLDIVSERLISPRIPFMQIRRLRRVNGQFGIYGQIINVPVSVNTMVNRLPRTIDDDHCINVHIKRKKIHKSSYLQGFVQKRTIKTWLQYLINTPLYKYYKISIDSAFLDTHVEYISIEDATEDIPIEESLTAQQQTLLWNDDKYLRIAPGEKNLPKSLIFDEHAEELSFPSIYFGQFRTFQDGVNVTPFMIATSELRRSDRRGVGPYHLLYMAVKIIRLRVRDSLTVAFKHIGKSSSNITRQQIESEEYINSCIESNLAFLRSIPNSTWYWAERKRDLFAMIRQLGKPTLFLTVSANEIGWTDLLRLLYKFKHQRHISDEILSNLTFMEKSSLVNDDAVTCAIYFNKLVNVLLTILQSKTSSPFGKFRVLHYFKRIEFQHRGSPHAHILLWLENAPADPLGENYEEAVAMIDTLTSVSTSQASGNIKLQTHKHTFTCYKKIVSSKPQECRFEAPFMPCRSTVILVPMKKTEPKFHHYAKRYKNLRCNLEANNYDDIDHFYKENCVQSDEDYLNILKAGITRPRVFCQRTPQEKWHNSFNPFILNILKSNMDIQFITEEYSCAAYVVEYVNKTNRGVSNLQRKIIEIMNEHPEFDIVEITRKMSVDMLNSVEMTSQEAAWYLLREPMSKSSVSVIYIATVWPIERQRIKKTKKELDAIDCAADSTDIWKEDYFDKYEKRPQNLEQVTLLQFVSNYSKNVQDVYVERKEPRIVRYRNYDMATDYNEYRREMVTLHIPFRDEENEILAEMKFITIYDENEDLILRRRREFESDLDIQKTIEICRQLCRDVVPNDEEEIMGVANWLPEPNPFELLYNNPNSDINSDLLLATLNKLGAIAKKKENILSHNEFCQRMRQANAKQRELLLYVIYNILSPKHQPLQLFFTGPAGCGKTFVIKLLMEIYNRFCDTDGYCNAYITCASTGKAAVQIDGTTIHTALKISISKLLPLSIEVAQQYRSLFKYVRVLIVDEISMIGAELLVQIDSRLKQITGNFEMNFGGIDIILIGDLRQLPPVRATAIYNQPKQRMVGPVLWRSLKFYELTEVMRQADIKFSSILTKLGNGTVLENDELEIIENRFFTKEEADSLCPNGIRLFLKNNSVTEYNNAVLNCEQEKISSSAIDIFVGCASTEQEAFVRQKLYKMSVIDTGGLPFEITFVINKFYILTSNIDVSDGLANGAVGKLVHMEYDQKNLLSRIWLQFPNITKTGLKIRKKISGHAAANGISPSAVPIQRRTSTIYLNNNKSILVKRSHFPLVSACAITIHKSQGGTFDEIVYQYHKSHSQQLIYVALSRVISMQGLYIVPEDGQKKFYHGRTTPTSMVALQKEFERLSLNRLPTLNDLLKDFISNRNGIVIFSLNCQSLSAHSADLTDSVVQKSSVLLLSESWMNSENPIHIENFNCIVHFKRPNVRAGGVAIYQHVNDTLNTITPHRELHHSPTFNVNVSPVGEVCMADCLMNNGISVLMTVVYISPNHNVNDIKKFLHQSLLAYTVNGAALLESNLHQIPMILSGDFNVNFSLNESKPLLDFLNNELLLTMSNVDEGTTRSGSTIDAVFYRHLNNITTKVFVSYFSYHKPLVSFLEL